MLSIARLNALHARKQGLLESSAVDRERLLLTLVDLEQRLAWADRGITLVRKWMPVGLLAIPLCRAWAGRRSQPPVSRIDQLLRLWPIARHFLSIWQQHRRK